MHTSLNAQVTLCVQTGPACSPDSKYTLVFLIGPNLAKIWTCARKHIAHMHTSLCVLDTSCAQVGQACFPHSKNTLISLIHPYLSEVWA